MEGTKKIPPLCKGRLGGVEKVDLSRLYSSQRVDLPINKIEKGEIR